jgi:hypothetical protein
LGTYSGDSWVDNDNQILYLYYTLYNGGSYQYNKVLVKDYNIVKCDGNAYNYIIKIFDLFNLIDVSLIEKYNQVGDILYQVYDTLDRDENTKNSDDWFKIYHNKLTKQTLNKISCLNSIHQKLLLNYSNKEIIKILNDIYLSWEIERFMIIKQGFLNSASYVTGDFSNQDLPLIKCEKHKDLIVFPSSGRGSLCSNFLAVKNFRNIPTKEGNIIKLKNLRKDSKIKKYEYLETSCDGFIAVKNIETNKIEFLADISMVEGSYDDLFPENKIIYKGWFNKRVEYIK